MSLLQHAAAAGPLSLLETLLQLGGRPPGMCLALGKCGRELVRLPRGRGYLKLDRSQVHLRRYLKIMAFPSWIKMARRGKLVSMR